MHPVTSYALDVIERKIITGKPEYQACLRHLHDLARAGQMDEALKKQVRAVTHKSVPKKDAKFPWIFDEAQASFVAIEWFAQLRHTEGRLVGEPIELCRASVFDIGCIFGWTSRKPYPSLLRDDGRQVGVRRFRKAIKFVGRKNAKTTEGSGILLYGMVGDKESNPHCYCAAVDKPQAREMYDKSKLMAENSPFISKRLKIRDYKVSHKSRGGKLVAVSKETKNKDGLNPSFVYIDEYHAHHSSEIYDLFSSAKGQRLQPLMITITTAGNDVESPCYKELEYCREIVSGRVQNDRYFVMIRELDKDDDEHDPANWGKANPLLVSTPEGLQELKEMHDEAFDSRIPEKITTFRIKNLNKWVKGASDATEYLTEDMLKIWDECAVPPEQLAALTKGMLCLEGVDLSKRIDLTADASIFALDDDRIALTAHGYMPEEALLTHEKTDKIPYYFYAEAGWLTVTLGNVTDYRAIQNRLSDREAAGDMRIHELCYDPYNATHFANEEMDKGRETVEVRQTIPSLSEATKLFRELLISRKIVHDGNPLLRAHLANARIIIDSKENIMVTKKNAGDTKRVDLLAATITALTRISALREAVSSGNLEGMGF
jgi:phage terminase large subunit-like protein